MRIDQRACSGGSIAMPTLTSAPTSSAEADTGGTKGMADEVGGASGFGAPQRARSRWEASSSLPQLRADGHGWSSSGVSGSMLAQRRGRRRDRWGGVVPCRARTLRSTPTSPARTSDGDRSWSCCAHAASSCCPSTTRPSPTACRRTCETTASRCLRQAARYLFAPVSKLGVLDAHRAELAGRGFGRGCCGSPAPSSSTSSSSTCSWRRRRPATRRPASPSSLPAASACASAWAAASSESVPERKMTAVAITPGVKKPDDHRKAVV